MKESIMKVTQKQANNDVNRQATQSRWQSQLAQVTNNNTETVAQRSFIAGINNSPRMLAQRQRIESYIGTDRQHSTSPVEPISQINQQQIIQRSEKLDDEEKETLQGKFATETPVQLKQPDPRPNNTGLPDNLKSGIESLSGMSMDHVKVHYNSSKPAQLNALAYAQGTDIHIAPGQEQHLPHEAWHVVQQAQGRVQPTMQTKGVQINDNNELEHEADVMGEKSVNSGDSPTNRETTQNGVNFLSPVPQLRMPPTILTSTAGTAQYVSAKSKLTKAKGGAKKKTTNKQSKKNKKDFITVHLTAPDSLIRLRVTVNNEVKNYATWLRDDDTWNWRSQEVKNGRQQALILLASAEEMHSEAIKMYPDNIMKKWSRREVSDYEKQNKAGIDGEINKIRNKIAGIDDLVKEPGVPPKVWNQFMGDTSLTYHKGTQGDPIPVVWYKEETHYDPIKIKGKDYTYPEGPDVQGRLKKYKIEVDPKYRYSVGSVIKNEKKQEKRTTQVDINYALKQAGANLNGLDGDHVTDLGFGGIDSEKNYWPLKAEVNRRPFLGWRSTYGVNYIDQSSQYKTATLGALNGKYLKIKGFMAKNNNASIPDEGAVPDKKSGTDTI